MKWNTNTEPKKEGWYLVTILKDNGHVFVMPLDRVEYPKGNFYWKDIPEGQVVAQIEFPKPYFI